MTSQENSPLSVGTERHHLFSPASSLLGVQDHPSLPVSKCPSDGISTTETTQAVSNKTAKRKYYRKKTDKVQRWTQEECDLYEHFIDVLPPHTGLYIPPHANIIFPG